MPYTYQQIGRKRGSKVTFAETSPDCICTVVLKVHEHLTVVEFNGGCPVHQSAPED